MDSKEDEEISIDFSKIKKFFKSDKKEEGKNETRIHIAKNLIAAEMPFEKISKITGLTLADLESLAPIEAAVT